MVGGGKARLESRAWLEARISVNNSRPTACIFLPDSFSLFPRSRKCDKIIRGRFNFFPNLSGTFHDTFINYDNFMGKFLYLRIISATNVEKFHILSIFQFNNNLSWLFILLTIIKYDSNLIIKIPLPKFYEFLWIHCYYTAIPPYQLNCKRFDIRTRRSVATKAGDCGKKEEKNPGLEPISAYTYKTI